MTYVGATKTRKQFFRRSIGVNDLHGWQLSLCFFGYYTNVNNYWGSDATSVLIKTMMSAQAVPILWAELVEPKHPSRPFSA
jgi:hypothetical protein